MFHIDVGGKSVGWNNTAQKEYCRAYCAYKHGYDDTFSKKIEKKEICLNEMYIIYKLISFND